MGMTIGLLHVRRSILIQAAIFKVWQEFESADRVEHWLNLGHTLHRYEPHLGGDIEMSVEIDGERHYYGGKVLVFEPHQELSFASQWRGPLAWPVPTFWTFRLTSIYDGTLVELFHHGFERLGTAAADNLQGYEEGWDIKHLKALRSIAED